MPPISLIDDLSFLKINWDVLSDIFAGRDLFRQSITSNIWSSCSLNILTAWSAASYTFGGAPNCCFDCYYFFWLFSWEVDKLLEFYCREVGWCAILDFALSSSVFPAGTLLLFTFLWEDCLALTLRDLTFFFWAVGAFIYTALCLLRD